MTNGGYKNLTTKPIIIGPLVDDPIGTATTEEDLDRAEQAVEKVVELDKRGQHSKMLGIELPWGPEQVTLTQTSLEDSMVRQFLSTKIGKTKLATARSAILCH